MAPGALPYHQRSSGGARWYVGLGFLQEAETLENSGQIHRKIHSHPQLLVFVTGSSNYQVASIYPLLCQRCVISLREIVPSEISESVSYR